MATLKRTMEQVMDRDMEEEGEDMEGGENCPLPTQDITLNLKNRAKAITSAACSSSRWMPRARVTESTCV